MEWLAGVAGACAATGLDPGTLALYQPYSAADKVCLTLKHTRRGHHHHNLLLHHHLILIFLSLLLSQLKSKVVDILTSPVIYCTAYNSLLSPEEPVSSTSFWPVIKHLARRGVYVMEDDDTPLSHTALSAKSPFREVSVQLVYR